MPAMAPTDGGCYAIDPAVDSGGNLFARDTGITLMDQVDNTLPLSLTDGLGE